MNRKQLLVTIALLSAHPLCFLLPFIQAEDLPDWFVIAWYGWVLGQVTLLATWAAMWGSHLERGPLAVFVVCMWPIHTVLATLAEVGILAAIGESMLDAAFVSLFTLNMAQGVCLIGSLLMLRWAGWQLVREARTGDTAVER